MDLIEELNQVQDELKYILTEVYEMQQKNEQIRIKRDEADAEFSLFQDQRHKNTEKEETVF